MYLASDAVLKQMFPTTFLSSFGTSLTKNCVPMYISIHAIVTHDGMIFWDLLRQKWGTPTTKERIKADAEKREVSRGISEKNSFLIHHLKN